MKEFDDDSLVASVVTRIGDRLCSANAAFTGHITQLAFALYSLRRWWMMHPAAASLTELGPIDAAESCSRLAAIMDMFVRILEDHEGNSQLSPMPSS